MRTRFNYRYVSAERVREKVIRRMLDFVAINTDMGTKVLKIAQTKSVRSIALVRTILGINQTAPVCAW